MSKHFNDCPTQRGYKCCTCDMCGESIALIEWQIESQEGRLRNIVGRASLALFGPGEIPKDQEIKKD